MPNLTKLRKEFEKKFEPNKERLSEWELALLNDYKDDIWSFIEKALQEAVKENTRTIKAELKFISNKNDFRTPLAKWLINYIDELQERELTQKPKGKKKK